ncbi:TIGR01777 family oxidoreductase [Alkalimonas collagenimarina]|uniref:TIGR01777 family oxidoreductase n=1 Tax=Alkalimonas collagenimarina TaxID=400390 RepID=A0ABT9GZK8_9GAMM|nr:TIGR01777 family oxidoreductase [Alkalimonas collagenimarina]MDP4536393.1 TIGR01777 family oxidoreductase [Alkalimonas collagenimarina]
MNILITGGTGLIGQALVKRLRSEHEFTVLSRSAEKVKSLFGHDIVCCESLDKIDISRYDAVINLAGEPIADKRWTDKQKKRICHSRWDLTEQLSAKIQQANPAPKVLISGSAIGFYGRQDANRIDESHTDFYPEFSHDICARWENLAQRAASQTTRVCLLRTGIVLAKNGGALKKMLPPFKLGLGGKIGDGQQYMSWIHIDDMVTLIDFLLCHSELSGPINATAPRAVNNSAFTEALAARLKKPARLPMPAFMARVLFGEMADLLLYGQNVYPQKLLQAGFEFQFSDIKSALQALDL